MNDVIKKFVIESNLIENIPPLGELAPHEQHLWYNHLAIAKRIRESDQDEMEKYALTVSGILEIHHVLLEDDDAEKLPGKFRDGWVSVGGNVKMPPWMVKPEMDSLVRDIRSNYENRNRPTRQEIENYHYHFEHIHPFFDGNGRTGRLWWNALLRLWGYNWKTVYFDNRQEYYNNITKWEREHKTVSYRLEYIESLNGGWKD